MKLVDVNSNTYVDFDIENNEKDPKFEAGDHVRISKYKNIFAKIYALIWYEEGCMNKKVKNTGSWTYLIKDVNDEEII